MKGGTKITVEQLDECGSFPIKETYVISRDNSFESIEDWVDAFNKIIQIVGFHNSIRIDVLDDEEKSIRGLS